MLSAQEARGVKRLHGVTLAAIKALAEQVQDQSARIERLERENRDLRGRSACEQ